MNHFGTSKTQFPMGIPDITSPDQLQVPGKSALERIIKTSAGNNEVQSNLQSRIRGLLSQLRGDRPVAGGCGGEVKTNSCALAVLEGSVADHSAMNCELAEMVEELESLLAY